MSGPKRAICASTRICQAVGSAHLSLFLHRAFAKLASFMATAVLMKIISWRSKVTQTVRMKFICRDCEKRRRPRRLNVLNQWSRGIEDGKFAAGIGNADPTQDQRRLIRSRHPEPSIPAMTFGSCELAAGFVPYKKKSLACRAKPLRISIKKSAAVFPSQLPSKSQMPPTLL